MEKIKLLELDIDFDNVIKRSSEARQNLQKIKEENKDIKKVLDEVNARYKESEERLKNLEKQGKKNTSEYELQKKVSDALRKSVEERNKSYEKAMAQERDAQKQYRVSKTVLDAFNDEMKEGLEIIVETDGSINQLSAALANNRAIYRELSEEQRNNTEVGQQLLEIIKQQNKEFKALSMEIGDTHVNVGNYTNGITDAVEKLKAGDLKGFTEDVKDLGTKWIETTKGIYKSIMTMPLVGWIAAVVVGIGLAVNEVYKYNKELAESNKLTASITKLQGDALDKATVKTQTLEEVLGLDRKETLESARALVNEFGITYAEALQRIEDGAIRGGAANDEYLKSLREYPTFFAKAGFSAKEFIDIVNAGYDLGIYDDKLPDALKEFSLSITEQTKTARTALVNAFGATFTDDLLKRVSQGKITVKESLVEISQESDKYSLSQKQQAQLTADLFKGAGEDAGGFVKVMQAVNDSLVDHNDELTDTQKLIKEQVDRYNELGEAKLEALKTDSFYAFKRDIQNIWLDIQTIWYRFISALRGNIFSVNVIWATVVDFFGKTPKLFKDIFKSILTDVKDFAQNLELVKDIVKSIFSLNFDDAGKQLDKLKSQVLSSFQNTKNSAGQIGKEISKSFTDSYDRLKAEEKAKADAQKIIDQREADAKKPTNNFDGSEEKAKADEAARKKAEEEAKKQAERLQKIAEANAKATSDLMKYELDEYIQKNKARIDNQIIVTANLLKLETDYLDEVHKRKLELLDAEKKAELSKKDLTEKEKEAIEKKYSVEALKLTGELEQSKKDIALKYAEQIKQNKEFAQLVDHQKRLRQIEKDGNEEFKIRQEQLDYEYQTNQERKDIQKQLDQLAKQTQDEETLETKRILEEGLNNIELEYQSNRAEIAKQADEAKLNSYLGLAVGIAQIAGKQSELGKAAAIAEIAIDKAKAVAKIITARNVANAVAIAASPVTFGQPMVTINTISSIKQMGEVLLSGALGIAGVLAANTNFSGLIGGISGLANKGSGKKAERGILLNGNSHARGGINLFDDNGNHIVEAEGDELLAVINKRSTGLLRNLSFVNQLGGGIPLTHNVRHAASGGLIATPTTKVNNKINIDISEQIGSTIAEAAFTGIQEGMRGLADDRAVMNDAKI